MTRQLDIIVVDDEPIVSELIHELLGLRGHTVRVAGDGYEGLSLLETCRADVLITDIFMPGKSGLEVIQEARRKDKTVKVIAMTGYNMHEGVEILETVRRYGVDGVIEKPIQAQELYELVEGFFTET